MGTLFDIILILTVLITVFVNFRLGIIRLLKPFRVMAAFILAWQIKASSFMRGVVSIFVDPVSLKEHIRAQVDSQWGDKITEAAGATVESEATRFDGVFGAFGRMFEDVITYCRTAFEQGAQDLTSSAVDYASEVAVEFFMSAIGFIIAFVMLSIILWLGCMVLNLVFSRGLLGLINRSLGGVVGLFFGLLIAWIASIILVNFVSLLITGGIDAVTGGFLHVVKWFHNDFLLSKIFGITPV